MLRNRYIRWILTLICLLLFGIFVAYNIAEQKMCFFKASAVDCVTIGIAVVVSYYLVQKQTNHQKQRDIVSDIVLKMQLSFEQKELYDFSGQDRNTIMLRNRDLNNRIHILEELERDFGISNEVNFIRQHFDEYTSFIGDHIEDINYLIQSQNELRRPIELVSHKLLVTAIHLYK